MDRLMTRYEYADRVILEYRNFDLETDEYLGMVREFGTVTRVWTRGNNVTVVTDSGKTFVRDAGSKSLAKLAN